MDIFLDILLKPPQPFIGLFLYILINVYCQITSIQCSLFQYIEMTFFKKISTQNRELNSKQQTGTASIFALAGKNIVPQNLHVVSSVHYHPDTELPEGNVFSRVRGHVLSRVSLYVHLEDRTSSPNGPVQICSPD